MALLRYQRPPLAQPAGLARINEKHWLADRLIFVHSGYTPFEWHWPMPDTRSALRQRLPGGTRNRALDHSMGWVPNGTNHEAHELKSRHTYPYTLSAWWFGVDGATDDAILSLSQDAGVAGGLSLRRRSTELAQVMGYSATDTLGGANATGGYEAGRWQHGIAASGASNKRVVFADAGFSGTTTGNQVFSTPVFYRVLIGATPGVTQTPCATVIKAIGLPMVIHGALEADEVDRLWREQMSNPWVLFAERPIMVPVTFTPATPTLSDLRAASITSTTVQGTYDYAF